MGYRIEVIGWLQRGFKDYFSSEPWRRIFIRSTWKKDHGGCGLGFATGNHLIIVAIMPMQISFARGRNVVRQSVLEGWAANLSVRVCGASGSLFFFEGEKGLRKEHTVYPRGVTCREAMSRFGLHKTLDNYQRLKAS